MKPAKRDPHEAWVLERATHFTTCVFKGRGEYAVEEHATLEIARARGRERLSTTDRDVMVYAVFGIHQAHIENIAPERKMGMTVYVLTWDGVVKNLAIATSPSVEDGTAALDNARANAGLVVAVAEDLNLSGPVLAVLHNTLLDLAIPGDNSENHVSRFATRGDGQCRVFDLLNEKFKTAPEVAAPSTGDTAATNPTETGAAVLNSEEGTDDMAKAKKTAKKTKAPKAAKAPKAPRAKKPAKEKVGVDDFGLRKGSKNAQAAAMFARSGGATMAAVKEKLGDTYYGMLGKLEDAGHKVKKDGKTIYLTAK